MIIVGCDYHPSFQQIAVLDIETGELKEQRLAHREGAGEPTVGKAKTINESGMALFHECTLQCAQNELDNADIVREAMFQQSSKEHCLQSVFA